MDDDQPHVKITLDQVYTTLMEVKGLVEGSAHHGGKIDDHEGRIRSLEKWAYAIPPTLILAAGSAVVAIF